jgi:hypothetical protein
MPIIRIEMQSIDPLKDEVADIPMKELQQPHAGRKQQDAFRQFQKTDQPDPSLFVHYRNNNPDYAVLPTGSTCRAEIN